MDSLLLTAHIDQSELLRELYPGYSSKRILQKVSDPFNDENYLQMIPGETNTKILDTIDTLTRKVLLLEKHIYTICNPPKNTRYEL
jgi:hypothetical protein